MLLPRLVVADLAGLISTHAWQLRRTVMRLFWMSQRHLRRTALRCLFLTNGMRNSTLTSLPSVSEIAKERTRSATGGPKVTKISMIVSNHVV